jgi:hypothetical protein
VRDAVRDLAWRIPQSPEEAQEWADEFITGPIAALVARAEAAEVENKRLKEFITSPPKHKFWGAGEKDCPREIKAPNGELHTLKCKVCGVENPVDNVCRAALSGKEARDE